MFKPSIIIPVYEHAVPLSLVLKHLVEKQWHCFVVDDGSGEVCRSSLVNMARDYGSQVTLLRLERNGGKGAAVKAGLRMALKLGFTHALQVDADGQHDLEALPKMLLAAEREPMAVICGLPVFDTTIPTSRLYGRRLTNFWIRVNTLSQDISDGMCGLRVYPLATTLKILDSAKTGNRMDFDPEILVRLKWAAMSLRFFPVLVKYPADGVSHFRLGQDNILISWMHTRLFFGMLYRLIPLLKQRCS